MCYANPILSRGLERFLDALVGRARQRADRPRSAARGGDRGARRLPARAGLALVPLVAPTTPAERLERIGAQASGFVYTVSVDRHDRRTRASWRAVWRSVIARAAAHTEVPVAVGFGISTPEQAAAAAAAGADGVIVGSRLVRAAGEATDPVAAVARAGTALLGSAVSRRARLASAIPWA